MIRVPQYAKDNADKGLQGDGYGTDKGRYRARYLQRSDSMSEDVAREVLGFLKRFHGMAGTHGYTENISGALHLWGGEKSKRFMKYLNRKLDD